MGTRRLWIALLLAVLHYTELVRGAPACATAPHSDCPTNLKAPADCDKLKPSLNTCDGGLGFKMYVDYGEVGVWEEITQVVCTANDVWTITKVAGGEDAVSTDSDNIICSKSVPIATCDPSKKPTSDCTTANTPAFCECAPVADTSAVSCAGTHKPYFLDRAGGGDWKEIGQVTCEGGEWKADSNGVLHSTDSNTNIICAKHDPNLKSCAENTVLGLIVNDCTKVKDVACKPVTLDDLAPLQCGADKLFYKRAGNKDWTGPAAVQCDKANGKWMEATTGTEIATTPNDEVLCATSVPLSCERGKPLISQCPDPEVEPTSGCVSVAFTDEATLACKAPSPILYLKKSGLAWQPATDIICNRKTGEWDTALGQLTGADKVVCAKDDPTPLVPCQQGANPLTAQLCGQMPAAAICHPISTISDDTPPTCGAFSGSLYFHDNTRWEPVANNKITCNKRTGKWEQGNSNAPLDFLTILCAEGIANAPFLYPCQSGPNEMTSVCDEEVNPNAQCDPIPSILDSAQPTCTQPKKLFYKDSSNDWAEVADGIMACDLLTGKWQQGSAKSDMVAGKLICAEGDPVWKISNCPPLDATSQPASCQGITPCELPIGTRSAVCAASNLYFVQKSHTNWMKAKSIDCVDSKWQVKYEFGTNDAGAPRFVIKDFSLADDKVICVTVDPTPSAKQCKIKSTIASDRLTYEFETRNAEVSAGQAEHCQDDTIYEIFFPGADESGVQTLERKLSPGAYPVCNSDGQWEVDNQAKGDTFVCRNNKCRTCPDIFDANIAPNAPSGNNFGEFEADFGDGCRTRSCSMSKMVLVNTGETLYRYSSRSLQCDGSLLLYKDGEKGDTTHETVEKAKCVQKVSCSDPLSVVIKTACDNEDGCEPARLPAHDFSVSVPQDITCPTPGKKIFIKSDSELVWDELTSITCNANTAYWDIKLLDGTTGQRGHKNRVICATENPAPRPTTTTTTTTEAPLLPICDVCFKALESLEVFKCEDCISINKTDLIPPTGEPGPDDECKLELKDKGRDLIINSYQDIKSGMLRCKRSKEKWETFEGGVEVNKVTARKKTATGAWKTMAYVVVGGVFVAIGGMAISCVVIYMRMRKQPSSREKKKKERGVTKKYTSSNVVKTNNKSTAVATSREATSKQGSASKMEENEDAPTLKL